jgi:KRAB domain-containing zinc finger protein
MALTDSCDNELYYCTCCDKKFISKEELEVHQILNHLLLPFKCLEKNCTKSFLQEEHLKKHLFVDHISKIEKPFKCKETQKCIDKEASFKTLTGLNRHLQLHGEKKFSCKKCSKVFPIKHYLESHLRTHSGERRYPCRTCNKRFSTSSTRNYHEKHLHYITQQ